LCDSRPHPVFQKIDLFEELLVMELEFPCHLSIHVASMGEGRFSSSLSREDPSQNETSSKNHV
jgi:hypothetical protein